MTWQLLSQELQQHGWRLDLTCFGPGVVEEPVSTHLRWNQLHTMRELDQWLRHPTDQIHSRETALSLAVNTYLSRSEGLDHHRVALGCVLSTSLDSVCWIASQSRAETHVWEFHSPDNDSPARLVPLLRWVLSQSIFPGVAIDVETQERLQSHQSAQAQPRLLEVWQGESHSVWRLPDGSLAPQTSVSPRGVLSGSFNPLHDGHRELRAVAERWLNGPVFYEMTLTNADKPRLDFLTIEERCRQFDRHPLWLTNAPTFAQKAELMPGAVFVVGADTAERIVDPRFYGQSELAMRMALDRVHQSGCRFLVAGRLAQTRFQTRTDIPVPLGFEALFETLPETEFRQDISSTTIRRRRQ